MKQESPTPHRSRLRGSTRLLLALVAIVVLVVIFPAYRWFVLISIGIGILVAGILYLWHKLRPVKADDVDSKRPLGL